MGSDASVSGPIRICVRSAREPRHTASVLD